MFLHGYRDIKNREDCFMAINSTGASGDNYSNKAQEFHKWANTDFYIYDEKESQEVGSGITQKDANGKPMYQDNDFQMFNFAPKQYSKDIKEFSQEYIDTFDTDKDGQLSWDEFQDIAGEMTLEEFQKAYPEISANLTQKDLDKINKNAKDLYDTISGVDGKDNLSAEELASVLQFADWDEDTQAYDGKIDWFQWNSILAAPDGTLGKIQSEAQEFYNYFYKDKQ